MKETIPYERKQQPAGAFPVPNLERLANIFGTSVKTQLQGWYQYVEIPKTRIRVEETPIGFYVTNNAGKDLYYAKELKLILKYCFQEQEKYADTKFSVRQR